MYTTRWFCAIVLTVLLVACGRQSGGDLQGGTPSNPAPGFWSGTTSQDLPITLRVVEHDGELIVTEIQYTIKMQASGWSVTQTLHQPHLISAIITDGRFSHSSSTRDGTQEISGAFAGDERLSGRLKCTHVHPQGLGTATGDVTLTASKQ